MNTFITVLGILGLGAAMVFNTATMDFMQYMQDYLNKGDWNDLTGGYEVLGGTLGLGLSVIGVVTGALLLALCIFCVVWFLIPAIHGVVLWINTKKLIGKNDNRYYRFAIRDSIIKMFFCAVPAIVLFADMCQSNIDTYELIPFIYLIVPMVLEIIAIIILKKYRETKADA